MVLRLGRFELERPAKGGKRRQRLLLPDDGLDTFGLERTHDAIVIGGGHNGLVCACYLAAAGLSVAVFERRGIVGGAAVTVRLRLRYVAGLLTFSKTPRGPTRR